MAISLTVFIGFSAIYLRETPWWNTMIAFGLIVLAVFFAFRSPG